MVKQILLADDSITIQKVVELTFSDTDYKVTSVSGGGQALAKVRESRPDIILCDVIMPEKNGYEVTEALKSSPTTRAIPIILLSGTFEPFDEDRARQVGADDWITKPFESQQLISKVEELLKKRIMVADIEQSVSGAINSAPGSQGKPPNPGQAVEFLSPMGMAPPPPQEKLISAAITLPPPIFAPEPAPIPSPVAALGAPLPPEEPSSLNERRQAVTQSLISSEVSSGASSFSPAPSMTPAAAPWAPLPPAVPEAEPDANATLQYTPPPPAPFEDPEVEIGAGTVQLMVDSVKPLWDTPPVPPPPAEAAPVFSPSEIRPSQLLEDTHRKGAPAVARTEPLKPWEPEAVPPIVPSSESVSFTEKTESLQVPSFLQAEPETPAPWLAPANAPLPGDSMPPFMAPALNAESAPPPWLSPAADPVPSAPQSPPSFNEPEPTPEPDNAAPIPSWLAPAYEPAPLSMEPALAAEPEAAFVAPLESSAPATPSWLSPEPAPLPTVEPPALVEPSFTPPMPEPLHRVGAEMIPGDNALSQPRPVATQPFPMIQMTPRPDESDGIKERRQAVTRDMTGKAHQAPALIGASVISPASAPWAPLPSMSAEPEPPPEEPMITPPVIAPEPEPVAVSAPAENAPVPPEPALAAFAGSPVMTDAQVEAIARRIVELFGDKVLREVAWEVIPDMAEMVIKSRIAELEAESHQEKSGAKAES